MQKREQSIPYFLSQAAAKFSAAQRQAVVGRIVSRLTGRSDDLLSFDEVRRLLRTWQKRDEGTHMIPLDSIVGSEGRYQDFTRRFLPLEGADRGRWMRLDRAVNVLEDLPPIEVYQVGDIYFVRDGHHRVSVARANGLPEIEAHVIKLDTPVSLDSDVQPEDLVLKAGAAEFLAATGLNHVRPEADVELTEPGLYGHLREHIDVHRHYMGLEQQREIPYEEAVGSWYDHVYLPVVELIRASGVMREFPRRTEADMYLWISHRREELRDHYGPGVDTEAAVAEFAEKHSERVVGKLARKVKRLVEPAGEMVTGPIVPALPTPDQGGALAGDSGKAE